MLERKQLYPIAFYKKKIYGEPAKFNGSIGNMHFRLGKEDVEVSEGEKKEVLRGVIWKGPFCYESTKEEKIIKDFLFAEEGISEAMNWFNEESKKYNK